MVASGGEYCDKCKRRNPIAFHIEPEAAWRTVVLNRWRKLCLTWRGSHGLRGRRCGIGTRGSDEPLVR